MVLLGKFFEWRSALVIVKPETFLRWHRKGFAYSGAGNPDHAAAQPPSRFAKAHTYDGRGQSNLGRGENCRRTAAEVGHSRLVENGPQIPDRRVFIGVARPIQRSDADLRAQSCEGDRGLRFLRGGNGDFWRALHVRAHGSRDAQVCSLQCKRPSGSGTLQQFREAIPGEHRYHFVIHDRDRIYSRDTDAAVTVMGVRVLRHRSGRPWRTPCANDSWARFVVSAWTS